MLLDEFCQFINNKIVQKTGVQCTINPCKKIFLVVGSCQGGCLYMKFSVSSNDTAIKIKKIKNKKIKKETIWRSSRSWTGSYFALLEFCSWRTEKGLYFRRLFRYCCFGIWMKIINYLLCFDFWFLFFTYSGVFNKNPIYGYVNSSAI